MSNKISPEWAVLAVGEICRRLGFGKDEVPKLGEILRKIDSIKKDADLGISFDVYRSSLDGQTVVHIDTDPALIPDGFCGPSLRVFINDDTENPIYGRLQEINSDG